MEKEKKNLHDHYAIIERLFLIGFVIMLLPILFQSDLWTWVFMFLGFGIMVVGALYANRHFRCPHCETKLNVRMNVPSYCPHCGEKLL